VFPTANLIRARAWKAVSLRVASLDRRNDGYVEKPNQPARRRPRGRGGGAERVAFSCGHFVSGHDDPVGMGRSAGAGGRDAGGVRSVVSSRAVDGLGLDAARRERRTLGGRGLVESLCLLGGVLHPGGLPGAYSRDVGGADGSPGGARAQGGAGLP